MTKIHEYKGLSRLLKENQMEDIPNTSGIINYTWR